MNRLLMFGGGLKHGHQHMATVGYPVENCPACIAIAGFLEDAAQDGWHMTRITP